MKAVSVTVVSYPPNDPRTVDVLIVADETPNPLPVNGADVEGLNPTDVFAPFSVLYVVGEAETKLYIANEEGVFVGQ